MSEIVVRPRVGWIVQNEGIGLIDADGATLGLISYPYAAVWDFLVKGYSMERCVSLFAAMAGVDLERAETTIGQCLSRWEEERYLEVR